MSDPIDPQASAAAAPTDLQGLRELVVRISRGESLAHLGADDALVVISVSPYSRRVVEVSRVAAQAGIAVIAITDSRASPLSANARQAFFIPHDSSFISNSLGAYIVFSEGMVNLVAKELDGSALSALERQEQFIESLNIEMR